MTEVQAVILDRMAVGSVLTHSLIGERLWSLLDDPFTVFDDVSPRLLLAAGFIHLSHEGSTADDRADEYRISPHGRAVLAVYRIRQPKRGLPHDL